MEFHSDSTGSDASSQMEPVLQRLEDDLDTSIRRINVFRRREFMTLLESIGFNECGNMPFYYNRRTGQAICGPTTYMNLRRWGTGDLNHLFQDPPENQHNQEEDLESSRRDVGFSGYFMEQMRALETRGKARAAKETAKRTTQSGGGSSSRQISGQGGKKKVSLGAGGGGDDGDDDSSEPQQVMDWTPTTSSLLPPLPPNTPIHTHTLVHTLCNTPPLNTNTHPLFNPYLPSIITTPTPVDRRSFGCSGTKGATTTSTTKTKRNSSS